MKLSRIYLISLPILLALMALLAYFYFHKKQNFNSLNYNLTYHEASQQLEISLMFKTDLTERTTIHLPSKYAEMSELYQYLTNVKAINARIEKSTDPSTLILVHKPYANAIIKYRVYQGWKGQITSSGDPHFHAPIFQKKYFQFMGSGVFIYPDKAMKENSFIQLDWHVPHGWGIANSYEINKLHQKIIANQDDFLNSLYIGGDYHFYKLPVKGGIIISAIKGQWPFNINYYNKLLSKIYVNERNFWNDPQFSHFLVSLIPFEKDQSNIQCNVSLTGYGLTNAFACTISAHPETVKMLPFLFSHEIFHIWNRPDLFDLSNSNEVKYYWFSEGFTNYFTYLLNLQAKIISLPQYVEEYNKTILNYYFSPVNTYTIEKVNTDFWKNFDVQQLPYLQGEILAHNWNALIKSSTNNQESISIFIKALIRDAKHNNIKLSLKRITEAGNKYKMVNFSTDINSLYKGQLIIPRKDSLGPCVSQVYMMQAPYELGFDIITSQKSQTITYVNKESRAYLAGLRKGQHLISITHHHGDIKHSVEIKVKQNSKIKLITYFPYKGNLQRIPQFILNKELWRKNQQACLAWFNN